MDYRIVAVLAIMATSCFCFPNPEGWLVAWSSNCPCTKIYLPLCASDSRTYNNMCEFECASKYFKLFFDKELTVLKEDRCETDE